MAGCKINNWVDSALRRFFYKLGYFIGKYPGYFIIVPIMVTALCATGFQRMDYNYDPEYLFSPKDGQAKQDRAVVESLFPTNYTQFKASRITRPGKLGRLLVLAKDGDTMLRSHLWNQLLYLDQVRDKYRNIYENEPITLRQLPDMQKLPDCRPGSNVSFTEKMHLFQTKRY